MADNLYNSVDASKGESIHKNRVDFDEVNQMMGVSADHNLDDMREEHKLPSTTTSIGTNFDYMEHQANRELFNLENGIESNIGRPGFGDSYYDQYASDLWDVENLNELRANEQGFISKIAGGLGRFTTITAMGTVGNIVGTVSGIVEGTVDASIAEDGKKWDTFWNSFWNNKVNQFVNSVIKEAEEAMPVYESEYEKNLGVLDAICTGSFWANQVANMGWTSAAIVSTVLTGGMGIASGASSLARILGASKSAANWIYRLIGGFTGSMSEAATEAINNYDESKQDYSAKIQQQYQQKKAAIDAQILQEFEAKKAEFGIGKQHLDSDGRPVPQPNTIDFEKRLLQHIIDSHQADYAALEEETGSMLTTIDSKALDTGTKTFGLNVLILGLSNTLGVFSSITTPMNNINRVARGSFKNLWRTPENYASASKGELYALAALQPLSEGNEEMLQKVASESAKAYYGQYYSPEYTGVLRDYVDVAGETFKNVYTDKDSWKEFAAGFFTGILGAGGLGHKKEKGNVSIRPEWTGGLINEIREINKDYERSNQIYTEAKDLYKNYSKDKNLQARTRLIIGTLADKDAMAKAVEDGDKKAFLDNEANMLIRAAETFSDIGRLNDLKALVGTDIEMSDDDIREFVAINSEEIKDENGNGTGRYKSNLPVVDSNGELLSDTAKGREEIRERLKKDQTKANKLIDDYVETIEETDRITGYSLNRDQLKMLTWARMKALDSGERQDKLGEELNKNIIWKMLYNAYLANRTYHNDDNENSIKLLEEQAEKLKEVIEEYNKLDSLTETQQKNKKIFETDYKNIKQALRNIYNKKKERKEADSNSEPVSTNADDKKTAVERLFELLDENPNGTLIASLLAAKVGQRTDEKKTPVYFANIVADLLEESMGNESAPLIDQINDLLKLNADRQAYDKMFREFIEAPEKMTDMLNDVISKSQDADLKMKSNKALKDYEKNKGYFENFSDFINSGFLEGETDENKTKIAEYIISNNTDAYDKNNKEIFKKRINDALDALDAEKTDKDVKDTGITKDFVSQSNLITNQQSLLYASKEDIIREAISLDFSDQQAIQIAYNLTKIANGYREMASKIADIKQKVDEAAEKKKEEGDKPKSDNTVDIEPTPVNGAVPENISKYIASLPDDSELGKALHNAMDAYVKYTELNSIGDIYGKVVTTLKQRPENVSSNALILAYNAVVAINVATRGKDERLSALLDNLVKFINKSVFNEPLMSSIKVQPFSLLPISERYDGIFNKSEVKPEIEVIEDKNFEGDKAFVANIKITEEPSKSIKGGTKGAFKVTIVKPAKVVEKPEITPDNTSEAVQKLKLQKAEEVAKEKLKGKPIFNITNVDTSVVDVIEEDKPWKNDPTKSNKTLRIYLKDQHNKGYFELVKDEEDGYYSVHFKTATDNKSNATYNAENTKMSSKEERNILFEQLANAIPDGALVSTHGELSPAGEYALKKLANLINGAKIGEREAKSKKDNAPIKIGIYQKDKPNVEATPVTVQEVQPEPVPTPTHTPEAGTTPQERTFKTLKDLMTSLENKVFFIDNGHTYYIYTKDDGRGKESFEQYKKDLKEGKVQKDDYIKYGFVTNTRSASTLRYGITEYEESPEAMRSQKIGNDIDKIIRLMFQGFTPEEIKNDLKYLVSKEDDIDNTVEIFKAIDEIKQGIEEICGKDCTILTDPINLIAKIKEENSDEILAGTPDMLVIDKNGVIHIFDMKAKKIDNLISKENPNAYRNENDYERYQTQLFAYAKMLKTFGFNVDTEKAYLIQFKTKDTVNPTYLGISELVNDGEGKTITDNIHVFDSENITPTTVTNVSEIGEALQNTPKPEEKSKEKQSKKEKQKKKDEEVLDKNDETQKSFEDKIKEAFGENPTVQVGYMFTPYHDYTDAEARGVYNQHNTPVSNYLREQGAYDYLNTGKVKAGSVLYFKDITPELRVKFPNTDYLGWHGIGIFVKDNTTGKLQIIGALSSDSRAEGGIGNSAHSINNNAIIALRNAKAFPDTTKATARRKKGITDIGYVLDKDNNQVAVNLKATAHLVDDSVDKYGDKYYTITNEDGDNLKVVKVAAGRIQTRPNNADGTRDLRPITSIKVNGEDFKSAFNNKRAFVGVLIGQDLRPTILDCDGEVRNDIQLKVPNYPSGSMIVVFKGADGEWKCSAILGNDFSTNDVKDKNNKVARNIDYILLHSTDGEYFGLVEDLYNSATTLDNLLDKGEIDNIRESIEKGFNDAFNYLNRKPDSVSYDFSSKVATLVFTIGTDQQEVSVETFGKSRETIKEEIYTLMDNLNVRYSLAQEIFLSDEATTEAKKQRLNSIIENSSSNIDEFTTRNTKPVLSYYNAEQFNLPSPVNKETYSTRADYREIVFSFNGSDYILRKNAKGASKRFQLREISTGNWTEDNQTVAAIFRYHYTNVRSTKVLGSTMDVFLGKLYDLLVKYDFEHINLVDTEDVKNGILHISETKIGKSLVNPEMYYDIKDNKFLTSTEGSNRFNAIKESKSVTKEETPVEPSPVQESTKETQTVEEQKPQDIVSNKVEDNAKEQPVPKPTPAKPSNRRGRRGNDLMSDSKSESVEVVEHNKNTVFTHNEGEYKIHNILGSIDSNISNLLKSVISPSATLIVLSDKEFEDKYGSKTNGIYTNGRVILKLSSSNNTIIHELCHLTIPSILQNEEAAATLTEAFELYKKYLQMNPSLKNLISSDGVSVEYATKNLYEFVSELFSNDKMIDILKHIPNDYFVKDNLTNRYVVNEKYRSDDNTVDDTKVADAVKKENLFTRIIRSIVKFFTRKHIQKTTVNTGSLYEKAYKAGTELIKSFDENADMVYSSDILKDGVIYSSIDDMVNGTSNIFDVKGKQKVTANDFIQAAKDALENEDSETYTSLNELINSFDIDNLTKETDINSNNISWNKMGLILIQMAMIDRIANNSNLGDITIFDRISFANYNAVTGRNAQGLTNVISNNVYINDGLPKFQKITIALHEIIHTLTSLELKNNKEFYEVAEKIFNEAKESVKDTLYIGEYGFTNVREFIAESLTNPKFMGILSSIKQGNDATALSETSTLVKKMLRNLSVKKNQIIKDYTVLDKVFQMVQKYGKLYTQQELLSKFFKERINYATLREYENKIDKIVPYDSMHSVETRLAIKKLNKAGMINDILPYVSKFNSDNSNREMLKTVLITIMPVVNNRNYTEAEIDEVVEAYYDYAYGYTSNIETERLFTLIETIGDSKNKLMLRIGANTIATKINFAVTDKNDTFASPLEQQINDCKI